MNPNDQTAIILGASATLIIFLAWLIRYKKKVNLIAGYDAQLVDDKDGLANWVGGILLATGIAALIPVVVLMFLPVYAAWWSGIFAVIVCTGAIIAAVGGSKFKRNG